MNSNSTFKITTAYMVMVFISYLLLKTMEKKLKWK